MDGINAAAPSYLPSSVAGEAVGTVGDQMEQQAGAGNLLSSGSGNENEIAPPLSGLSVSA